MTTEEYKKAAAYWTSKERKEMPQDQLKSIVEEYLSTGSVCALATGTGNYVRCTPLEYSYHDGKFWIFTEGGEKFIGLEKNDNISLAVFDKNPSFGELKSVQVIRWKTMCFLPYYYLHQFISKFLIYMVFRPAPVLIIAPSSTSFLSADSTEELPRLGHEINASCFENLPSVFSVKYFTIS